MNRIALIGVCATLLQIEAAGGQAMKLDAPPTCKRCRILSELVTTIGGPDDPGNIKPNTVIARDSRGLIYAAPQGVAQIAVYDRRGRFLRVIGQEGQGPGEFYYIRGIDVTRGDSLYVWDEALRRISVFSPQYDFVRSAVLPRIQTPVNGILWDDRSVVMVGRINDPTRSGFPLHVVDAKGTISKSFGFNPAFRSSFEFAGYRRATASASGWWLAHLNHYTIEHWSRAGTKTQELRRTVKWFAPWWSVPILDEKTRTPPTTVAIDFDSADRVWVAVLVPDRRQRSQLEMRRTVHGVTGGTLKDQQKAYDTMVEVIDPAAGHVLAARRLDVKFLTGLGHGYYASYREDRDGAPFVDVWRLRLQTPR